jgi:hypothetical protein
MDAKMGLRAIEELLDGMLGATKLVRLQMCCAIKMLTAGLEREAKDHDQWNGYMSEKFGQLIWSAEAIAELNDGNGQPAETHLGWAHTAIDSLESSSCFGGRP